MNTPEEVTAALAKEPKQRADGMLLCQVCGQAFRSQGMGPHQLKHRMDVGLVDRRVQVRIPPGAKLKCPLCGSLYAPHSIPGHLRSVHDLSKDDSVNMSQKIRHAYQASRNGDREPSRAVAVVDAEAEEESPTMWRDVSAVDAATDILSAARRDGLIPVKMLPDIFDWMVSTGKLLHRLERLSR